MTRKSRNDPHSHRSRSRRARSFRQRYDEAEQRRREILARLASLSDKARAHPAYKRALTLLNATFRKATVAQRIGVLGAADWLVDLLKTMSMLV